MKTIKNMLVLTSAILANFFCSASANAATMANVITEGIDSFNRIQVEQAIAVEFVKGDQVMIEYEYENAKNNSFGWEVKDNTLHLFRIAETKKVLGLSVNTSNVKGGIRVRVTAPYDLNMIELAGASSFKTRSNLDAENITIMLSGASHFECNGDLTASRKAHINISGASNVKCGLIKANKLDLEASGASHVSTSAIIENLMASISGASYMSFDGKATDVTVSVSGASKLNLTGNIGDMKGVCSGASRIKVMGSLKNNEVSCSGASSVSVN